MLLVKGKLYETEKNPETLNEYDLYSGFPLDLENLENLENWEHTWKTWKYHGILNILINIMEKL